jgi:hypothetical protein
MTQKEVLAFHAGLLEDILIALAIVIPVRMLLSSLYGQRIFNGAELSFERLFDY